MPGLATLLQQELTLLESFSALLAEERGLLERGEADALPALANLKMPVISALNTAGNTRNQWLKQQGFPADTTGIEACVKQQAGDKNLQGLWQRFLQTARQTRELNSFNAQLLSQQLQATSEALEVLGQEARRQALYGSDGQPTLATGNRVIDSA